MLRGGLSVRHVEASPVTHSIPQEALKRYSLREKAGADPQTYALGLKEVWQVGRHLLRA